MRGWRPFHLGGRGTRPIARHFRIDVRWLQGMQNRSLVVICGGDLCGGVETQVEDQQQAEARSKRQEDAKPKVDEWGQPIQEGLKPVSEASNNDKCYRQLVCGGVAGSSTANVNHLMGDGGELEFNLKTRDRGKRQLLKLQYDHRRQSRRNTAPTSRG